MAVSIGFYDDWMKDQVVKLFCNQYGESESEFLLFFEKFYEHHFQKHKAIKIVALDGEKVVGFQSFFYWPYQLNEEVLNTFQSGNSLVHPQYRGQGLFKKMLDYSDNNKEEIDFLVGFPVQASFNSFIRNGWSNPFNLQWYLKQISYTAPLFNLFFDLEKRLLSHFNSKPNGLKNELINNNVIKLVDSQEFISWRKSFSKDLKYFFYFKEGEQEIEFELKYNIRKRVIGELIIGKCSTNSQDREFIQASINKLFKLARKTQVITVVSAALNPTSNNIINTLLKSSLKEIDKQIHFITKGWETSEFINTENWNLSRGDIDTW